jgi:hypothetical protein
MRLDPAQQFWNKQAGEIYLGEKETGPLYIRREDLNEHAHFLGPTGTGKTRALQLLAEQLIDSEDCAVVVLDPHDGPPPRGGLYHALKTYCYDRGHEDRLIAFDPAHYHDHGMVAGFNPLTRGRSPIVRAGLAVEHLRAVSGHGEQSFAQQPMLARWGFNSFLGLIVLDLAMADAAHVLSLDDPTYRRGFATVLADKYPDVASDWKWLVEQEGKGRGREIIDDKLGSTTSRLRFYTTTEVLRVMLSTRQRFVDPSEVLRKRQIVLANLSPRGLLLEQDQRMLGVQFVHAFCRAAMERTDPESGPCYLIVDEFSKFLTPEILEILDGGRKFGIHLVLAHQYLSQLQQVAEQDWRYYQAVLQDARLRIVFGGLGATDTSTMAEHMYGAHLDPMRVKDEIHRTLQTSKQEWMTLRSHTRAAGSSSALSEGRSSGHALASSEATAVTTPLGGFFEGLSPTAETFSQGYGSVLSGTNTSGAFEGESQMEAVTEAFVPVNTPSEPFQELSSREFMALEEQLYEHAKKMRQQPHQHAVFQRRGDYPVPFKVGDVPDPSASTDELVSVDGELLRGASWAVTVEGALEEARERDRAFRELVGSRPSRVPPPDPISDPEFEAIPEPMKQARTRPAHASPRKPAKKRTTRKA